MSTPNNDNNDIRNANDNSGKKSVKFALVAALLAGGILAAALTAGQVLNTAVAQTSNSNDERYAATGISANDNAKPYYHSGQYLGTSTVSTSGTATTKVKPDKFSVSVGVETNGTTAQEAASSNADSMAKVLAALQDLGIKEDQISTSNYNVYPVYDYGQLKPCIDIYPQPPECQPKQVITGYRASNSITATLDVSGGIDAGQVIDAAVEAGATNVNGVYFFVSPDKQQQVQDGLIEDAIASARHRADVAASALGLSISGVQSVNLNDVYFPIYSKSFDVAADGLGGAMTPILPGEQEVSSTVSVVFYFSDNNPIASGNQTMPSGMTASQNNPDCTNPPNGPMIC